MADPNLAVYCPKCQVPVSPEDKGSFVEDDPNGYEYTRYTLARCPKCSSPMLLRNYGWEDSGDGGWMDPAILYPGTPEASDVWAPPVIATSYIEALRCLRQARSYTATAIMCRRTLEGICSHFQAEGRNLATKLSSLKNKGIIDSMVYHWADGVLRTLGNDAAHDVNETIEEQDARDALEFTRAIIEYVFVFHVAYERFRMSRERRAARARKKAEEEPA